MAEEVDREHREGKIRNKKPASEAFDQSLVVDSRCFEWRTRRR